MNGSGWVWLVVLLCTSLGWMAWPQTPTPEPARNPSQPKWLTGRWWSEGASGTLLDFDNQGRVRVCRADRVVWLHYEWISPNSIKVGSEHESNVPSTTLQIHVTDKRLSCQAPGYKLEHFYRP